ncbi:uncharacterized protein LOC114360864 isoform X1 [Ostrinia furnacalis]|uniref:uncharacterized protein LOC114360864 isoform X1 n=2 Tax=Ostrinia furnacalis TaxID=93504 RepID=UPI0010396C57|nr:uncharacterized protein LOC114360864 isoform X1 [Ostrinia furnacalis]
MAKAHCFIILLLCISKSLILCDVLCEQGFCATYVNDPGCSSTAQECSINNATHHGLTLPSPTICNCCDYCLPTFNEGAHCSLGGPGTGTTIGRCGDGLTCIAEADGNFCRRMNTTCHRDQDDYDARHLAGETGELEERPSCDGKGKYDVFSCVPTQTCFCQSEDGERIFGEAVYLGVETKRNMHCRCSRLHEKIKKNLSPGVPYPVVGPRCTPDGNFHPIQCIDRKCYCVDTVSGEIVQSTTFVNLDETPLTELDCYDADLDLYPEQSRGDPPYNLTTPCIEGIQDQIDLIQQSEEEGYNVDFFSTVQGCLPDGTPTRIVTSRNRTKICVDERGEQIGNYQADPNTPEYNNIDCKCARTSHIMSTSSEKPICCSNGNFRKIQCRRGMCRCVDSDGRQTEMEQSDVTKLSCYTADWRTC